MKIRFTRIIVVVLLCFVTASPAYSVLQPDRKYFKEQKSIDSLVTTENIRNYTANIALLNSAVNRLVALGNEYRLTNSDAFNLLNLSLIVQHPKGEPMKLALDTEAIIAANAGMTRLRYKTNTDPGASGSPCFSMDWDIVALHHYGDPAWQRLPEFNQGIPIHLIQQRLNAKGLGDGLGH